MTATSVSTNIWQILEQLQQQVTIARQSFIKKNSLQIDGNNVEVRLELTAIYLKVGQGPSAVRELTKAGELG